MFKHINPAAIPFGTAYPKEDYLVNHIKMYSGLLNLLDKGLVAKVENEVLKEATAQFERFYPRIEHCAMPARQIAKVVFEKGLGRSLSQAQLEEEYEKKRKAWLFGRNGPCSGQGEE